MVEPADLPRRTAREIGIVLGRLPPGPANAITDVAGVRVGHATLIRGAGPLRVGEGPVRTGITVILPHGGDLFAEKVPSAAEVFNGYGKSIGLVQIAELGELETPLVLTNTLSVGRAADALVAYMIAQHPAIGVTTGTVNPVVCECNDSYLNDIGGRHVGEPEVLAAIAAAQDGPITQGNVGAGTGMGAYGYAAGIGSASRRLPVRRGGYTIGVLVLANFGRRGELTIAGVPVGRELLAHRSTQGGPTAGSAMEGGSGDMGNPERGSVIVVLATDAPLDARQLGRLARRVPLGLARTGTHGGHGSGDLAVAFSTANRIPHEPPALTRQVTVVVEQSHVLDGLFAAAVEATEEAVVNALCTARPMDGRDRHRYEALPIDATLAILRRHGPGI